MERHFFNLDKTVSFEVEVDCGRVVHMWNRDKNFADQLGFNRALNVSAAVEFMLKESTAISCATECGVTVHRGQVKQSGAQL